jgi:hypothetical protein
MAPRRPLDSPIDEDVGERFIPPESIHDKYLSKYIQPLAPIGKGDTPGRPAPLRSTSTPASNPIPISQAMSSKASAVPLRGLGLSPTDTKQEGSGGKARPIFEIFNAELSEGSEGMVKALKGHLDDVLRVQKEIGRMHLALEGLGEGAEDQGRRGSGTGSNGSNTEQEEGKEGKEAEDPLAKREREVDELMKQVSLSAVHTTWYNRRETDW